LTLHRVVTEVDWQASGRRGEKEAWGDPSGLSGPIGSGLPIAAARFPHLSDGIARMGADRLIGRGLPALRAKVDGELRALLAYRRDGLVAAGSGVSGVAV
jgi:hypothetical protein